MVARRVCATAVLISRPLPEKFATPATADMLVVPSKLPPPLAIVSDTVAVASAPLVTTFPLESSIVSTPCVEKGEPAVLLLGWVVQTNCEAAPFVNVTVPPVFVTGLVIERVFTSAVELASVHVDWPEAFELEQAP